MYISKHIHIYEYINLQDIYLNIINDYLYVSTYLLFSSSYLFAFCKFSRIANVDSWNWRNTLA